MARLPLLLLIGATALSVTSCFNGEEDKFTIVEGTVVNKYTGQPVAAAPVVAQRFDYRIFGHPKISPVTTALTDAGGRYRLSFDAGSKGTYRVKVEGDTSFFDLTAYPEYEDQWEGWKTEPGRTNTINFAITPYQLVAIEVRSNKGGKTDIGFDFNTRDGKAYFGGRIFNDSVHANQKFYFKSFVKLLPNREYSFSKTTRNRVRLGVYTYEFRDEVTVYQSKQIPYGDNAIIKFD